MGFILSWMAVEGASADEVCRATKVQRTGRYRRYFEGPASGVLLPSNWYVVVYDRVSWGIPSNEILATLSKTRRVVWCDINDTVMCSALHGWVEGEDKWSVFHFSEDSIYDISEHGDVPDEIGAIKKRQFNLQEKAGGEDADVDYVYDVPVILGLSITGFEHESDFADPGNEPFEELISSEPVVPEELPPEEAPPKH